MTLLIACESLVVGCFVLIAWDMGYRRGLEDAVRKYRELLELYP